MATSSQINGSVIPITSDEVKEAAREVWPHIRPIAESLPEPTSARAAGFLPTERGYAVINIAEKEYPHKAFYVSQPGTISKSRKGGVVYFSGKPGIATTFTIMIPISIKGDIKINGISVDLEHYYHILRESILSVPKDGMLVAFVIDNIVMT